MFSFNGLIYHTLHQPGKHRQFSSESLIPGESWSIESKSNIKIVTSQESTGENVVVISLAVRLKQWKWKRKKIHNMNCNQTRGWSNEVLRFMGFVCLFVCCFCFVLLFGGGGAKNTSLSFKWLLTVENKEADSCWLHTFPLLWFDSQGFILKWKQCQRKWTWQEKQNIQVHLVQFHLELQTFNTHFLFSSVFTF